MKNEEFRLGPLTKPLIKRKERESNSQGSSLGRFRDGCRRQSACPSVPYSREGGLRTHGLRFPKPADWPTFLPLDQSTLRESNPHILHGEQAGCRYITDASGTRRTRTVTTLVKSQVCCR